jgi:hypothetical protein
MKVFIQDKNTRMFIASGGEWITDMLKAQDFERIIPALDFCAGKCLSNVFLLLYFPNQTKPARVCPFAAGHTARPKRTRLLQSTAIRQRPGALPLCDGSPVRNLPAIFKLAGRGRPGP